MPFQDPGREASFSLHNGFGGRPPDRRISWDQVWAEVQCPGWKAGKKLRILVAIQSKPVNFKFLFDSLSFSRHGESSVELSSVMILDPMNGNSLAKAT
jgi:hypothetical protein